MLNMDAMIEEALLVNARDDRKRAAARLAEAAGLLRKAHGTPMEEIFELEMEVALEAFEKACDYLRFIESGAAAAHEGSKPVTLGVNRH